MTLTTAHRFWTQDTTSRAIHVQLVPIQLFYKVMTSVVVYVSVASKPYKQGAREYVLEKNGNDLASLDPVNIVKDYVAGLMDRPCNVVWEIQKQHSSQSSYNWQQRQAADDLWDWRHVFCVKSRRTSFVWFVVCQARLPAYAAGREGFSPKAQHLDTSREMESTAVSSTACAD